MAILKRNQKAPTPAQVKPVEVPATSTTETTPPAAVEQTPAEQRVVSMLVKTRQQLADARALKDQLLIELARGEDRDDKLAAISREIADLEQRESYQKAAVAKLQAENTAEAKAARWTASRDAAQATINDARALKERIAKLIESAAQLGNEVRAIDAERHAIGGRFSDLIGQLPFTIKTERRISEKHDRVRSLMSGLTDGVPRELHARNADEVKKAQARAGEQNDAAVAHLIKLVNETLVTLKGL